MPGTKPTREIELIIENVGGGGRGPKPPVGRRGDDNNDKRKTPGPVSSRRYYTGIAIAIISILVFFMALVSAYLVRKGSGYDWKSFQFPQVVWLNTALLLFSSTTIEVSRRRLDLSNLSSFKRWWGITTGLGFAFLVGQLIAWRHLVKQGVYVGSNPSSSFFYIFTGAHAVHIVAGLVALLFVAFRNFDHAKISRATAVAVTSYFWHFLDGLWVFLALLLYFGK
jgi:cytochrome c oxidase subunit III